MNYPVIIMGAGGHAKVLIDVLFLNSIEILGATDADPEKTGGVLLGVPVIGDDEAILKYPSDKIRLVNGIGSVNVKSRRRLAFASFKERGYCFAEVIHPSAIISRDVTISEGAQIMAGAVVQTGSHVGENVIINTHATIDHDCHVGNHTHVSPGATLSGMVWVGENVHIGTGASVIQGVRIGAGSLIAAGAVVVRDLMNNAKVAGVPAREMAA